MSKSVSYFSKRISTSEALKKNKKKLETDVDIRFRLVWNRSRHLEYCKKKQKLKRMSTSVWDL